jgi:ubiquinone/menaquinone biosynthesis C-methylase UbiE
VTDISSANLAYAIRQNRELGDGDTKFYLADLTQLKPDAFEHQFDFIVANSVLHFFSDLEAWKNLTALLRPGKFHKNLK